MNKTILTLALAITNLTSFTLRADVPPPSSAAGAGSETNPPPVTADAIIAETLAVIQAEGWSASDVADAIRSLRGLYLRDNATEEGRQRWNGKIVSTSVDTNSLTRTTVYENGEVFVDPAAVKTPAMSVKASNSRLPTPVITNGIPAKLAEARARRQAEKDQGVTNVTVYVKAGGE